MTQITSSMNQRQRWYIYLNEPTIENRFSLMVALFIATVIVLNIIEVIIGSIPHFGMQMKDWYLFTSQVLIVFFAVEYFTRVWVAADAPHESQELTSWEKRKRYIFSPLGVVDFLSFVPFLLFLLIPAQELNDLRILKLFAMARLFKLTRYSSSLTILFRVYQENKQILLAAFLVIMALMFVSAAGIYIFERDAQPDDFGSIPAAMWWALVTLTTVGYGDVTPITVGGKIFGSLVIVCGVGVAAMPAGIFASSFVQLMKQQERQARKSRRMATGSLLDQLGSVERDEPAPHIHLELSRSEQLEVDYLIREFNLTLDQAVGVVVHFRH